MKEIELTPKAEEDLEGNWDYSFRQFGVVQADAYIRFIQQKEAGQLNIMRFAGKLTIAGPLIGI